MCAANSFDVRFCHLLSGSSAAYEHTPSTLDPRGVNGGRIVFTCRRQPGSGSAGSGRASPRRSSTVRWEGGDLLACRCRNTLSPTRDLGILERVASEIGSCASPLHAAVSAGPEHLGGSLTPHLGLLGRPCDDHKPMKVPIAGGASTMSS
jgi:hypothetical protein